MNSLKLLLGMRRDQILVLPRLFTRTEKVIAGILTLAFVGALIGAAAQMTGRFAALVPAQGGEIREGVVGIPRFINPLLAVSDVDRDLTTLVYAGLTKFTPDGAIEPALAESYEISADGLTYTFHLRENARWSDGEPITADDIIFTVTTAKNPQYHSIVRANWEGVGVEKIDERTIRFRLQKPYAPFLENTALGILPQHVWRTIAPAEFSLTELNIKPIGGGPYKARAIEKNKSGKIVSYTLERNKYYLPKRAYLKSTTFIFYVSEADLAAALRSGAIDSAGSLSAAGARSLDSYTHIRVIEIQLPRVFGVFFNQNTSKALADVRVREALELAANKNALIQEVLAGRGTALYSPIPPGTFGASDSEAHKDRAYNIDRAREVLEKGGWTDADEDGIREKKVSKSETVSLSFVIATSNAANLVKTGQLLQQMWRELGARVELKVYEIGDFEQNILRPRKYDAVLFGEVVGHDPDPFAFWHSSQRNDPGLNIALYTNTRVDSVLEKARSTTDTEARRILYKSFQSEIRADTPAVFLYTPSYLYAVPVYLKGIEFTGLSIPSDRFFTVENWYIKTKKDWDFFQ